jgi:multidrug efflux system membrane fusion protein
VDGERVAIAKGLSLGELVVTDGGDRLRDGAEVTLPNATPASAAAANPPGGPRSGASGGHKRPHPKPAQ